MLFVYHAWSVSQTPELAPFPSYVPLTGPPHTHTHTHTTLAAPVADTRHDATTRLAAWMLYLRKHSASTSTYTNAWRTSYSSGSPELSPGMSAAYWGSWIALLPGSSEATNANGFWTPAELQQLQVEPYKVS